MKKSHYAVFEILKNGKLSCQAIHDKLKEKCPYMGFGINMVNVAMLLSKLYYLGYIQIFAHGKVNTYGLTKKGIDQLSKIKKES